MLTQIHHITVDALDPYAQAQFWSRVFGTAMDAEDFAGDPEALVDTGAGGPGLLFVQVPEAKTLKNRVHLDFTPGQPRDQEVERLVGMGASFLADHRRPDGSGWVVLGDPEGNELCVERSEEERTAGLRTAPAEDGVAI